MVHCSLMPVDFTEIHKDFPAANEGTLKDIDK